jgi:tRNA (cytosine34-C5)-methyltransferase
MFSLSHFRAAEMLAVGGKMVYSTCSLNSIENEAVLCRLLKETGDSMEIVEAGSQFKDLIYKGGMTKWVPASKDLTFYEKFEDVPLDKRPLIYRDLFPPQNVEQLNLQHCIRVLPHFQNTGGFFIAVLVKKKLLPWEKEIDDKATETAARKEKEKEDETQQRPAKRPKFMQGYKEDPFKFFKTDDELFVTFKKFFALSDDFEPTSLFTRCAQESNRKNIYFCANEASDVLRINENKVKVINAGVKAFIKCDRRIFECPYRLSSEGVTSIQRFIGPNRRIHIKKDDLIKLLNHLNPADALYASELSEDIQRQHRNLSSGSCVLQYNDEEHEFQLFLVGWRGTTSVRAYIDVNDSIHILRLLDSDLSKYGKI